MSGNLTKPMAQMTSFGVAPMTEATVNTVAGMLRPNGDRVPNGFDHLTKGVGRTLTLPDVTHHLRMMERGKGKDVAGWAPEHLCVALGHPDLGRELTNFLNHFISGNLCDATQRALMLQTVTLLNEGTKGKLCPLGCAATFCGIAYGALVRGEATNLAKVLGPTQNAVGHKAALESLSRHTQSSIKTKSNAALAQFDCSSAFNHADRTMILSHIRRMSPHLAHPFYNILSCTTLNLVREEDGSTSMVPSNDGLTHGLPSVTSRVLFSHQC